MYFNQPLSFHDSESFPQGNSTHAVPFRQGDFVEAFTSSDGPLNNVIPEEFSGPRCHRGGIVVAAASSVLAASSHTPIPRSAFPGTGICFFPCTAIPSR